MWIDTTTAMLIGLGVPGPGVPVTASIPTPAAPVLVGLRCAWQAASFDPTWGIQASNASTYVHRL